MFKKITVFGALLLITASSGNSARAGVFDWVSQTENNYIVPSDWSFDNVLKKFQLTKEEVEQDKKVELEITIPKVNQPPQKTQTAKTMVVVATAYSSTPDQTDSTPFITAWNTRVRDGIIAANFLPFGTRIRVPEIFGDKIFVVEDRMHQRYHYRIDVWFPERQMAKKFGIKKVKIEVVES